MTSAATESEAGAGRSGPLRHLRVLEVAELVAAPFAGRLLRDLGATVTKVERPRAGDATRQLGPFPEDRPDPEASAIFAYLNRGKRGITLAWDTPSGRQLLEALLGSTDVLLVDERFGASYEELERLCARHPRLIAVSITPFGLVGPRAHWRGSHAAACALGGLTIYTGEQEREPITPPHELGSYQGGLAGAIAAVLAVLARGGSLARGQVADIAVADVLSSIHTGNAATHWVFGSRSWIRHGRRSAGGLYPNTILRCANGWFRIQAMSQKEWRGLLEMIGSPAWGDDPKYQDRIVNQEKYADQLDAWIEEYLTQHPKQELFEQSLARELPFSPLREMDEVMDEAQLRHRRFFARAALPDGREFEVPGVPYRHRRGAEWPEHDPGVLAAPRLGGDNERVLGGELGLSRAELEELRGCGVI